jgi:hypothetical protein
MSYLSNLKGLKEKGVFIKYSQGYFTFLLKNGEKIIFEEVDKRVLNKFDLSLKDLAGKEFEVYYSKKIEYFEDDDFIIYRIEDLELI